MRNALTTEKTYWIEDVMDVHYDKGVDYMLFFYLSFPVSNQLGTYRRVMRIMRD